MTVQANSPMSGPSPIDIPFLSPASTSAASTSGSPSSSSYPPSTIRRVGGKANVSSACGPCKKAHLACDVSRPCKRCITVGKEDLCEDIPHKKRGRPKVPKPALGVPYARARQNPDTITPSGRWRSTSGYDPRYPPQPFSEPHTQPFTPSSYSDSSSYPYPQQSSSAPADISHFAVKVEQPDPTSSSSSSSSTYPYSQPQTALSPPSISPPLFTLFTSTDLRILRCNASSYSLTGYPAQDFINVNLLDWVHPQDRPAIEMEHSRLMINPMCPTGQLHTDRDTQEALAYRTERELVTPVQGMKEPYPNQNVRIMRADHQYAYFNVRLHLGGGLGGSLWHPETLGRVYFVVSLLLLPQQVRHYLPATAVPEDPHHRRTSNHTNIRTEAPTPSQSFDNGDDDGMEGVQSPPIRYDPPPPPPISAPGYQGYPAVHLPRSNPSSLPSTATTPTSATCYPRSLPSETYTQNPSASPSAPPNNLHQPLATPESYAYNQTPITPSNQYPTNPNYQGYYDPRYTAEQYARNDQGQGAWVEGALTGNQQIPERSHETVQGAEPGQDVIHEQVTIN